MQFVMTNNPVGEVKSVDAVQKLILELIAKWDAEVPPVSKSWWEVWVMPRSSVREAIIFLLNCLDALVLAIDNELMAGADKKATVLDAISTLYDYTVRELLPVWAKPFSGVIKQYVVYVVVSNAIDWLVAKYHNAVWPKTA